MYISVVVTGLQGQPYHPSKEPDIPKNRLKGFRLKEFLGFIEQEAKGEENVNVGTLLDKILIDVSSALQLLDAYHSKCCVYSLLTRDIMLRGCNIREEADQHLLQVFM
jgi:hypothetical protein